MSIKSQVRSHVDSQVSHDNSQMVKRWTSVGPFAVQAWPLQKRSVKWSSAQARPHTCGAVRQQAPGATRHPEACLPHCHACCPEHGVVLGHQRSTCAAQGTSHAPLVHLAGTAQPASRVTHSASQLGPASGRELAVRPEGAVYLFDTMEPGLLKHACFWHAAGLRTAQRPRLPDPSRSQLVK